MALFKAREILYTNVPHLCVLAKKHHSCRAASKKAGKKKTWFHGKCRTRKQKTQWKRAHKHRRR